MLDFKSLKSQLVAWDEKIFITVEETITELHGYTGG